MGKLFSVISSVVLFLFAVTPPAFCWAPEPDPSAFTLPVNQWTKVAEAPADPYGRELEPGQGAYLCYFPDLGLFYRYGGYTPTESNCLYSFSLAQRSWVMEKAPDYNWPPPSDRPGAGAWWSMAYDSKRKVIWMMGGSGTGGKTHPSLYHDIWKFDPATGVLTKMNSTGYYYSEEVRIVYDSINDRILRAPARDNEWAVIENRDVTRIYDPNTNSWESKSTPGCPKNALAAVWVYAADCGKAVYMTADTTVDSLNCFKAITWTYDYAANAWAQLNSTLNPPARVCAAAAYDPVNRLVMIHGGVGGKKGDYGYAYRGGGIVLEDTWVLDLSSGQWSVLSVGKPAIPTLRKQDGNPLLPQNTLVSGRLVFTQAAAFDVTTRTFVVSSPQYGVWALRYQPAGSPALPDLNLPALPALPAVSDPVQVFPGHAPNPKLLNLVENRWLRLNGGSAIGGGEIPLKYDETTGWVFKYGGCNNHGTTFASGYGNDLVAYDPAVERWITVRAADPCGPPRPANGCTRFYAHDPGHQCSWFAGGTAGNYLAASQPQNWGGGSGTWRYDCKKDKYELVPSTGAFHGAIGVMCAFDRADGLFVTPSQQNWGTVAVSVFNSTTHAWSDATTELHAQHYTYADFADSIGRLLVMDGDSLWALDPVAGAWNIISRSPEATTTRPSVAYDCYNNVCLVYINSKTYIYDIHDSTWTDMAPDSGTPNLGEHVAFDRRHGVFLGGDFGGPMYAYKYKNVPGLKNGFSFKTTESTVLSAAPNPFTGVTAIRYELDRTGTIRLSVYDPGGRLVQTLACGKTEKGSHTVAWKGAGATGLYLVRLETGRTALTRPVLFVK